MRNRIYGLSFAIAAALYANVAAAHAVLVSSSPANGSALFPNRQGRSGCRSMKAWKRVSQR